MIQFFPYEYSVDPTSFFCENHPLLRFRVALFLNQIIRTPCQNPSMVSPCTYNAIDTSCHSSLPVTCFLLGFHPSVPFSPLHCGRAGLLAVPQSSKSVLVSGHRLWDSFFQSALCHISAWTSLLKSLLKCTFLRKDYQPPHITWKMNTI